MGNKTQPTNIQSWIVDIIVWPEPIIMCVELVIWLTYLLSVNGING